MKPLHASPLFDRVRNVKKTESTSSELTSKSSVNNEIAGICPKCGSSMKMVEANTHTRGVLNTYYCESCCVATPVKE
jgi:predicted RNA-binding Zn-ribbon protein involved in translation (DUF1610 family)